MLNENEEIEANALHELDGEEETYTEHDYFIKI